MKAVRFKVDGCACNGPFGYHQGGDPLPDVAVVQDGESELDGVIRTIEQATGDTVTGIRPDGREGLVSFYRLALGRDGRATAELWLSFKGGP